MATNSQNRQKPQIVFRLSKDMLDWIDAEATRINRTRTEVVLRALEAYIDGKSKPAKKTT